MSGGFSTKGVLNEFLASGLSPLTPARMKREAGIGRPGRGPAAGLRRETLGAALELDEGPDAERLAREDAARARHEATEADGDSSARLASAQARRELFWQRLGRIGGSHR